MMIIASIFLTVGAASALEVTNEDAVKCGDIYVEAIEGTQDVSVEFISLNPSYGPSTNPGLDGIWLNLTAGVTVTGYEHNGTYYAVATGPVTVNEGVNQQVDGFGRFNTELLIPTNVAERTTGPIVIYLSAGSYFEANDNGKYIAVHVISLGTGGVSTYVTNGECGGGQQQEIPEFPTIALPVAAILGLAFFFQRRKE